MKRNEIIGQRIRKLLAKNDVKQKELAKELKTRCDYNEKYTFEEYQKDMERDNLYQEVNNRIKKE